MFRQLLDDAARGEFDVVVVHTLDRWSRNLRITLESLKTLSENDVSLVSISENIDYSKPEGKLFTQMLGSFAEYFSGSLATHVSKGHAQRAARGRHLGGIPFGYRSCWKGSDGQRVLDCEPEHPGGVHLVPEESEATAELFRRYATGTTTTTELAIWLNDQGFRTRNRKRITLPDGRVLTGPRYFTNSSVRTILHNPFYAGWVRYRGERLPGSHESTVPPELFEQVQVQLKKNAGRSATLNPRANRHYLLKGLVRCVHCGTNAWAQTYKNGNSYYREKRATSSAGACPARGGSIPCHVLDEQVEQIVRSIRLPADWLNRTLEIVSQDSEVSLVHVQRAKLNERLKRLVRVSVDGLYPEDEYRRQKHAIETQLESLVVPEIDAAEEAGRLLGMIPELWDRASTAERHELLTRMLDAVYVDMRGTRSVVQIKPKPAFRELFGMAKTASGTCVDFVQKEPPEKNPGGS